MKTVTGLPDSRGYNTVRQTGSWSPMEGCEPAHQRTQDRHIRGRTLVPAETDETVLTLL